MDFALFVLMMAGCTGTLSCRGVITSQKVQEVRGLQFRHAISFAPFVDQKRKGDARFIAKHSRVVAVA